LPHPADAPSGTAPPAARASWTGLAASVFSFPVTCVFLPAVAPFGFLRDFLPQVFLATAAMFPAGKEHTTVANGPCSATVIRACLVPHWIQQ